MSSGAPTSLGPPGWPTRVRTMAYEVACELVANVIGISVAAGDVVQVGTELVLLESMKMEIPVLSDRDGRVAEVKVHVGDVVQEGDVMVVLT